MTEQESLRKIKIAALKSCDVALEKLREINNMMIDQQTCLEETLSNNLERLLAVKDPQEHILEMIKITKETQTKIHEHGWEPIRFMNIKIQFVEDQKKNIRKAKTEHEVILLVEVIAAGLRKEQVV